MLIGAHISAAGGVDKAPQNAHQIGCEVFQFFSRSPRGGKAPKLSAGMIRDFKDKMKKYKLKESYIHSPYYINLASEKNNIFFGSVTVLREELERGTQLGVKYMMTHLGSAKDLGEKQSIKKVASGLNKILKDYPDRDPLRDKGTTQFLIEISAGSGKIIGDSFEEIKEILKQLNRKTKGLSKKIGVCFDTAHAFQSGYDLRNKKTVKKTFDEFDKTIGLKKLKLIHVNDSKTELGSHIDRHENIGYGKIGLKGFKAIINDKRLKNINLILETPDADMDIENVKILKKLRDEK